MKKDDLISLLTSAGIAIPDGATVAILTELAKTNGIELKEKDADPAAGTPSAPGAGGNGAGPAAPPSTAPAAGGGGGDTPPPVPKAPPEGGTADEEESQHPFDIAARKEIAAMTPAAAPKGITEEAIGEKTRLGLSRAQAIEIISNQAAHDAVLAAEEKAKKGKA